MSDGPDPKSLTRECEKRPTCDEVQRCRRTDEEKDDGKRNGQPGAMAKQPATDFNGDCAIDDW